MKEKYEGQGLERLVRITVTLAVVGVIAIVGTVVWGVLTWLT